MHAAGFPVTCTHIGSSLLKRQRAPQRITLKLITTSIILHLCYKAQAVKVYDAQVTACCEADVTMTQSKRDALNALADVSETPTESNASKSCSPELVHEAADCQAAAKPQLDVDASSIAAPHAKKAKLQQQLHTVERQVTAEQAVAGKSILI